MNLNSNGLIEPPDSPPEALTWKTGVFELSRMELKNVEYPEGYSTLNWMTGWRKIVISKTLISSF
jgi:hypothetical protein